MEEEHFEKEKYTIEENRLKRAVLVIFGTLSLSLGIIGVFIPILPTTPFLLLSAACYIRSSPKLYNWLITNRYFGKFIVNYREHKGIPLSVKVVVLILLWATILISALYATENIWLRSFLIIIAISVSLHVLFLKTLK